MTPSTTATAPKVVMLAIINTRRTLATIRAAPGSNGFSLLSDILRAMPDSVIETVTIAPDEAGSRLDRVLAAHIATLSRSHLKTLTLGGHVALAGRTICDPAAAVKPGAVVTVTRPPPQPASPPAPALPLTHA